jgi:hypothetical protein
MKVWGATEAEIRDALAETGLKVYGEWNDYGVRNGIYRTAARSGSGSPST